MALVSVWRRTSRSARCGRGSGKRDVNSIYVHAPQCCDPLFGRFKAPNREAQLHAALIMRTRSTSTRERGSRSCAPCPYSTLETSTCSGRALSSCVHPLSPSAPSSCLSARSNLAIFHIALEFAFYFDTVPDVRSEIVVCVEPIEDRRVIAARTQGARCDLLTLRTQVRLLADFASKYRPSSPSPRIRHPDNLTSLSAARAVPTSCAVTAKVHTSNTATASLGVKNGMFMVSSS